MNAWPVISRELQTAGNQIGTYWLRVAGGGIVLAAGVPAIAAGATGLSNRGGQVLGFLNSLLFTAIWILSPILAADCISRERREGTLGLLFLTPLTPASIVIAKGFVHALRTASLLLAAVPVLTMCLLIGGVSHMDILRMFFLDSTALLVALSTALMASSSGKQRTRVMAMALILSLGSGFLFIHIHHLALFGQTQDLANAWGAATGAFGSWSQPSIPSRIWTVLPNGFTVQTATSRPFFGTIPGGTAVTGLRAVTTALAFFVGAILLLLFVLWSSARQLRAIALADAPTQRQQWWLKRFCRPIIARGFLRSKMRRALNRNPIGWLQQYSWNARLTKWGWCLSVVVFQCLMLFNANWGQSYVLWEVFAAFCLLAGIAFTASNSFASERQSGALELILVTPLCVSQIIGGRLRGIVGQFLPGFLVWALIWLFCDPVRDIKGHLLILAITNSIVTALIGLYFSLRQMHFLAAWLATVCISFILTGGFILAIWTEFGPWRRYPHRSIDEVFAAVLYAQIAAGVFAWILLYHRLARRAFHYR